MSLLRRTPLSRLVVLALAVLAVSASVAVATNLTGPGRPKPQSLAAAIHQALSARPVPGVSAQITLTNDLLSGAGLQQSSPLITGASGRLWASNRGQLRLELQSDKGDSEVFYDGVNLSYYEGATRTLYKLTRPQAAAGPHDPGSAGTHTSGGLPGVAQIQSALANVMTVATLSGAQPTNVAGRPAYRVLVRPRSHGGLIGGAALAWDALTGLPLRLDIFAANQRAPVFTLVARRVTFGAVSASVFQTPHAAHTQILPLPTAPAGEHGAAAHHGKAETAPATAQALAKLPFTVLAPASVNGVNRTDEQLVTIGGHSAALITYGLGLGAIRVLEQKAEPHSAQAPTQQNQGGDRAPGSALPKVNINGAAALVLPTALGSLVRYERRGVSFTLAGSVPAARAEAFARGLP